MMNAVPTKAAVYARFSSQLQSDTSIEDQVHRARAYLVSRGFDAGSAQVFADYAISGASMDRPGMRALETAIKDGNVDLVITESVDRISRDVEDAARFRKLLTHHDCALECLDGTRVGSKGDVLNFGMRSVMAEMYRVDLADKTLRGLEGNARNSRPTGGVPYGYRVKVTPTGDPRRPLREIEIHPEHAAVVRRIFADYLARRTTADIASALNAEGVPSPRAHSKRRGLGWMHSAVRSMLLNASYAGRWDYGVREWRKDPGTNVRRPKQRRGGPLVTQQRPELALIDLATFNAVAESFEVRKFVRPRPKSKRYPLTGLMKCECGAPMTIVGSGPHYRCSANKFRGTCPHKRNLRVDAIEREVQGVLTGYLGKCGPRILAMAAEELDAFYKAQPTRQHELTARIATDRRRVDALVTVLADEPSVALAAKVRELEKRVADAETELATTTSDQIQLPSPSEYAARVRALEGVFDGTWSVERARSELSALVPDGFVCAPQDGDLYKIQWRLQLGPLLAPNCKQPMVAGAGFALLRTALHFERMLRLRPSRARSAS